MDTAPPAGTTALSEALRACRGGLFAVAGFSFCANLLLLAAPIYMLQVYDRVLSSRSSETLLYLTLIVAFALAGIAFLDLARSRLLATLGGWIEERVAPTLVERAVHARLVGKSYGAEALGDLATVRNFVAGPGMAALFDLPWTLIFVAVIFLLHPWLGWLTVASAGVLLGLTLLGEFVTRRSIVAAGETTMALRRHVDEMSRNGEAIEAMGMMPALSRGWQARNQALQGLQSFISNRSTLILSTTKFLRMLMQVLALGLGAWLVLRGEATGGIMIAAAILLARALSPIEQVVGAWRGLIGARAALGRLRERTGGAPYRREAMELPPPLGAISVEALVFRPPQTPARVILKGISFRIDAGQVVAVIGPSGAGKSTLVRLMVGAVAPTSGIVRLDGADVHALDRAGIGKHVGYLPQDVQLFSGTVASNISRMSDAEPSAIVEAAELADVHASILRLPEGYDTEIGPGGQYLSGGERQRIGLARALFGRPRFIVLDEPNANLDGDGERALTRVLRARGEATIVFVTHRRQFIDLAQRTLYLKEGRIEDYGPTVEVMERLGKQARATAPASPTLGALQKTGGPP